ncbi:MAG: phage holin family protein [Anaeroplasmataceae bacterium]|nr:phage holin family protein [Anaeroplasmataceae bacterium]
MNKKLIEFLTENSFTIEENGAYAYINDYQVAVGQDRVENALYGGMATIVQAFSHLEPEQISVLQAYLKEHKKELNISKYEVTPVGVCFAVMKHFDTLMDTIKQVTYQMLELNAKNKGYCPITGEALDEATMRKLYYNNFIVFLNEASVELLNQEIEQAEQEFQNAPNNYLKGTLGAVVGGFLGAIVWVVVAVFLGFISGWIAFLISFLAGLGYDKMKGKATNIKFIISAIVTLCYVVLAMLLIYVLVAKGLMIEEGVEGSALKGFSHYLKVNAEFKAEFIGNMVLAIIFGAVGVVFSYFQMKKTIHKKQEKLN